MGLFLWSDGPFPKETGTAPAAAGEVLVALLLLTVHLPQVGVRSPAITAIIAVVFGAQQLLLWPVSKALRPGDMGGSELAGSSQVPTTSCCKSSAMSSEVHLQRLGSETRPRRMSCKRMTLSTGGSTKFACLEFVTRTSACFRGA